MPYAVDLPACAATCDPSLLSPLELWEAVCNPETLFTAGMSETKRAKDLVAANVLSTLSLFTDSFAAVKQNSGPKLRQLVLFSVVIGNRIVST